MSKRIPAPDRTPAIDPTVNVPRVTLEGVEYKLALDFGSLAEAEAHFLSQGIQVNILYALPALNLNSVRVIWPCAIRRYHPDITFEQAQALVNIDTIFSIVTVIADVWRSSLPDPTPAKPGNVKASA